MSRLRVVAASALALALIAATVLLIPTSAQAQGFSVEIGSYSIPDNDGSVQASLMVDPGGIGLAAIGLTLTYDAALVSLTGCDVEPEFGACNDSDPGTVVFESVTGDADGWTNAFVLATLTFTGIGVEGQQPLDLTIDEAYDASFNAVVGTAIDGSISVSSRAPAAVLTADCANNDGSFAFELDNPMDEAITYTIAVDGVDDVTVSVESMASLVETVTGVPDDRTVAFSVTASGGFGEILNGNEVVRCDAEVTTSVTCDGNSGVVTVAIVNYSGGFASYSVDIGGQSSGRSISDGLTTSVSRTLSIDDNYPVTVARNGSEVFSGSVTVECGGAAPTPTPLPPTPTPTPVGPTPTPTPNPGGNDDINGADAPVELMHVATCLGENGRVDTNIVNTGTDTAAYRIEFGGLSARQANVGPGDWWRMPITGRPDRDHQIVVKRDGVTISDTLVTVSCDSAPPVIDMPEVQVVNGCRAGNGYVLFQFTNATAAQKSWVIEFEGVSNRSTSAAGYGGAVRAVTGRQDGVYDVLVRTGQTPVASFEVTVSCD